jgi:steroid delta-isomerase-like uncharacterized protein
MSTADNVKIVQASWDAINAHNLDALERTQAANFSAMAPGAPGPLNSAGNKAYIQGFITAFPDLHFNIVRTVAEGDYVVTEWVATGTHTGPLVSPSGQNVPPTGKKATTHGSNTFEVKNGKLSSARVYWDMVELLGQLGLMPPM